MAELSAGIIDQQARASGNPDIGNGPMLQPGDEIIEAGRHFPA